MKLAIDKNILISTAVLSVFGVIAASLLASTDWATSEKIKANEIAARLNQINEILPKDTYNNTLLEDLLLIPAEETNNQYPIKIYRARKDDKNIAAVIQTVAPNGYAGPIKLLVSVLENGTLSGVRVLSHRETPGLGDKIELRKSPWILGFNGKSLDNPKQELWAVKKDGGAFDQITGATISPRIITKTVLDSLIYFNQHREMIFTPRVVSKNVSVREGNHEQATQSKP